MAKYFDAKHTPITVTDQVYIEVASGVKYGYKLPDMSALDVRKDGPCKVKRKIGKVAFEFDLPDHIKVHPVSSCIHLEPALLDPYQRQTNTATSAN